ncbi:MAG: hypothetical protein VX185_12700 [Pseudomonadota bacterium]|nr:hypothetical protein [Pseudomonadota bacterium]
MKEYTKIYNCLNLPQAAIGLALGELQVPNGVEDQPAQCYGFPPAMIPLWSNPDSMTYTGIWKHWFSNRTASFIRMYVNTNYRLKEIARNFHQLAQYIILEEISFSKNVTDEIALFAENLGVSNLRELDQLSIESGDDPKGLFHLPTFKDESPLICFDDLHQYKGDFPNINLPLNSMNMKVTCSLELTEILERHYICSNDCPAWFYSKKQKELFYSYLSAGSLSEAWFTLNSNGWLFKDAKPALEQLASKANNRDFNLLTEAWNSLKHDKYKEGY